MARLKGKAPGGTGNARIKVKAATPAEPTPEEQATDVRTNRQEPATNKAPGVIQALIAKLRDGGGTPDELYAHLAALFPDRATAKGGMHTTIAIQLKRLPKEGKLAVVSEHVEGHGTVYRAA